MTIMQMTIEVPDDLPQEIIAKRIKDIEGKLKKEAEVLKVKKEETKKIKESNDPWINPDIDIPSVDTGREDGSISHDHYIYGTPKR